VPFDKPSAAHCRIEAYSDRIFRTGFSRFCSLKMGQRPTYRKAVVYQTYVSPCWTDNNDKHTCSSLWQLHHPRARNWRAMI
jgi:hypothetical protein